MRRGAAVAAAEVSVILLPLPPPQVLSFVFRFGCLVVLFLFLVGVFWVVSRTVVGVGAV